MDSIRAGPLDYLFLPDSYVSGQNGTGNNRAKGHYIEDAVIIDSMLESRPQGGRRLQLPPKTIDVPNNRWHESSVQDMHQR